VTRAKYFREACLRRSFLRSSIYSYRHTDVKYTVPHELIVEIIVRLLVDRVVDQRYIKIQGGHLNLFS